MWNGHKISVVLPTYNERDSIRECIERFLATGCVDEVLVVNNNAAPGTSEEVAKTRAREVFEPAQGYGASMQRGLGEAKGEWIVVCEPDGTFQPEDIFKFFHIPLQSGSDKILSDMGRGHSIDDFRSIVERVRERYPRATLSTDIIVGFPGETAQDHEMNIHAVEALRPEILNITRFSRRRGTRADVMKDQVHGRISKELSRELTRLHRGMLPSILGKRLGIHKGCLVTEVGKVEGTMMARDQSYLPIVIDAASAKLGEFVDIETCEAGPTYLKGKVVGRSIIRPGL